VSKAGGDMPLLGSTAVFRPTSHATWLVRLRARGSLERLPYRSGAETRGPSELRRRGLGLGVVRSRTSPWAQPFSHAPLHGFPAPTCRGGRDPGPTPRQRSSASAGFDLDGEGRGDTWGQRSPAGRSARAWGQGRTRLHTHRCLKLVIRFVMKIPTPRNRTEEVRDLLGRRTFPP